MAFSAGGAGCLLADDVAGGAPEVQPVLLQMVRDDAIHRELGLSDDQVRRVLAVLPAIDGPWFRVRIRPAAERVSAIEALGERLMAELLGVLDGDQLERLEQLQNQALGTRMIVRDAAAAKLRLSGEKRAELYGVFRETDRKVAELQERQRSGDLGAVEAGRQVAKLQTEERKQFVAAMSNEQQRMLSSLTGPSFDFSSVKRMYPFAPELTSDGSSWLQGTGVDLEGLRGKVVAIHFYAFQCINCRRNLPHYNGWHRDYADDGLVVIGIQTPETGAERSVERVSEAIRSDGIEYPVLMDLESKNWAKWSNTMWPTVYLVDKKGFLRRWWQGEMNWKGTPGEKQMRETIEILLSEEG